MAHGVRFRAVRVHTLAFPPDITKKLDSMVAQERATVSDIVTEAVRRYLEERGLNAKAIPDAPEEETFTF